MGAKVARVAAATGVGILSLALVEAGHAPAASAAGPAPHVMVVMMENKNFSDVIGQKDQPYTNALADGYGLATRSYGFGHPSLPNYLTLVSGSNQGVTDDGDPSSHSFPSTKTVAGQLSDAGFTARAYAENLPANPRTNSGNYAVRHVPWEYFPNTPMSVRNATTLTSDLNGASPPDFVWFTPNVIDDEHNGTVQQGDAFLKRFIPAVQSTAWYRADGQIIIEWDESDNDNSGINGGDGGHIPTIVVSAANKAHPVRDGSVVDSAGVLRSIEDRFGLAHLANAANAANGSIDSLLAARSSAPAPKRVFTSAAHASAVAGHNFLFEVKTSGTPVPTVKKHGRLARGIQFHKMAGGKAMLSGTPNLKHGAGTYHLTFLAKYGKGKTKQIIQQTFTLTVYK